MESMVWKFTMESIVLSIWKEYGNYNVSFYVIHSSNRRDLYVFQLLRFDIVKNNMCIISFLLVL